MRVAVALVLVLACKSSEDAKQTASDVKDKAVDKVGAVKDKAVDVTGTVTDKVVDVTGKAVDKAADVKNEAFDKLSAGYTAGKRVKAELDKVYKTTHDYELAAEDVSATSTAGEAHAAKLAALPSVKVGDATVGYEEDVSRSIGGATYSKHFRASWRRGDKIYRVSYFTSERIDAVAFAALLQKLVPVVERVL